MAAAVGTGAAKVLLTGLLVRELGGLAPTPLHSRVCAVLVAPVYLGIDHLLSMNTFEPLFWMGCVYCVVLGAEINRADHRYLVPAGAGDSRGSG